MIKINSKYKLLTDGDFRKEILSDSNFNLKSSNQIKYKKIITIDMKDTMYNAYRLINKNQINCILVLKKKRYIRT